MQKLTLRQTGHS